MRSFPFLLQLLGLSAPMTACSPDVLPPSQYDAALLDARGRQILYLRQDELLSMNGQPLARFAGDTLYNLQGQALGYLSGSGLYNLAQQRLGSVSGGQLLNLQDQPLLRVEGARPEDQARAAMGFFFLL